MRILGIDYGEKRVGIAVSDEGRKIAFPKIIILNDNKLFEKLEKMIKENDVSGIVVGESTNFKGAPNLISGNIDTFIKQLSLKFKLSVFRQKEFLTSVEARKDISPKGTLNNKQSHTKVKTKEKKYIDNSAAALILQRYLDKINK